MDDTLIIKTLIDDPQYLPHYASLQAAGADLKAHIPAQILIAPGASALIPTGLKVEIPSGYEIQIRPRSGLALKHQVTVLNTPGTIDADYRGEIGVILINHGKEAFVVTPGMRIAQAVVAKVYQAVYELTSDLIATTRGEGGFGHSGTH
jgi:dUTP pyrophosphatase